MFECCNGEKLPLSFEQLQPIAVFNRRISLTVVWPSGTAIFQDVQFPGNESISNLRMHVEAASGQQIRALISQGSSAPLAWDETVASAGLHNSSVLTAVVYKPPRVFSSLRLSRSTNGGAVVVRGDGKLIPFGSPEFAGRVCESDVLDRLEQSDIRKMVFTEDAFAALSSEGVVIVHDEDDSGGDCSAVEERLQHGVRDIVASCGAFAALLEDGSVVAWGDPNTGGDCEEVEDLLQGGVQALYSNMFAFVAVKDDNSVVTWGWPECAGDFDDINDELEGRRTLDIASTAHAFAALLEGGKVVAWGREKRGGNADEVADQLESGVTSISATGGAFAAVKESGIVVVWGDWQRGGPEPVDVDIPQASPRGAPGAASSAGASSLALTPRGGPMCSPRDTPRRVPASARSVLKQGELRKGMKHITSSCVQHQLRGGVEAVTANEAAFAALMADGTVVTWGNARMGGDQGKAKHRLQSGEVERIYANSGSFAAVMENGDIVTWGHEREGGDSRSVQPVLRKSSVSEVHPMGTAFLAVSQDDSAIVWGWAADTKVTGVWDLNAS